MLGGNLFKLVSKTSAILYSFSCYESPRMFGDAGEGGLVIDRVFLKYFLFVFFVSSY